MICSASKSQRQVDGLAPLIAHGNLSHLDGHSFIGDGGLLGIALTKRGLQRLQRNACPSHWLIPLDQPSLAEEAAALPGEVLWLSTQPPVEQLGLLNVDVQGVWKEGDAVVINALGKRLSLLIPEIPLWSMTTPYLARTFMDFWMGNTNINSRFTEKSSQPNPPMEVAA